jgi:hypothetical protein
MRLGLAILLLLAVTAARAGSGLTNASPFLPTWTCTSASGPFGACPETIFSTSPATMSNLNVNAAYGDYGASLAIFILPSKDSIEDGYTWTLDWSGVTRNSSGIPQLYSFTLNDMTTGLSETQYDWECDGCGYSADPEVLESGTMTPAPTPEPSTILLCALAGATLVGVRFLRRMRNNSK